MPRRRPSQVRTRKLMCGTHRASIHQVPGLGPVPMAAVIELEHTRIWPAGLVAAALRAWTRDVVCGIATQLMSACTCPGCQEDDPRGDLEQALVALPRWAEPYLYSLVLPLDRSFLAQTLPDPLASPDWPWWRRRLRPTFADTRAERAAWRRHSEALGALQGMRNSAAALRYGTANRGRAVMPPVWRGHV